VHYFIKLEEGIQRKLQVHRGPLTHHATYKWHQKPYSTPLTRLPTSNNCRYVFYFYHENLSKPKINFFILLLYKLQQDNILRKWFVQLRLSLQYSYSTKLRREYGGIVC
jgi:hypothetical protein